MSEIDQPKHDDELTNATATESQEEIISTEGDPVYEGLMDLRHETQSKLVAVCDLDGTLAKSFTMGRWAEFLEGSFEFQRLVKGLESRAKEQSQKNLDKLLTMFDAWEDGNYNKGYLEFIKESSELYAKVLRGLKKEDVFAISRPWAEEDAPRNIFGFSRSVVRLLKYFDIVPTLVTGTPEEAVSGFRDALGIEEACHALKLHVDKEGHYTGEVKYLTGLPTTKARVIKKMQYADHYEDEPKIRRHTIAVAMGDTKGDSPLLTAAARNNGIGIYCGNDLDHLRGDFASDWASRRIVNIEPQNHGTFAIVELMLERMRKIEALSDEQREKIMHLLAHPEEINMFLPSTTVIPQSAD